MSADRPAATLSKRSSSFSSKRAQETFNAIHGDEAHTFRQQVESFRKQIRQHERWARFVLHPGQSNFLNRWDAVTAAALLYTLTLTPFEAAFLPPTLGPASWLDPWFIANRCLDVIFVFDMVLQFFIAFQQEDILGGHTWVEDQRLIARNYVMSWFLLDASVIFIPGAFDLMLAAPRGSGGSGISGGGSGGGSSGGSSGGSGDVAVFSDVSVLRTLRVVRLAKLGRLLRASRLYRRWQSKINISSSAQTIIQCTLLLCVGAHWAACLIGIQTALHASPSETWLGPSRYNYCDAVDLSTATQASSVLGSWEAPLARCQIKLGSWYLASLTWALMLITGTGGTDYYPSSDSDAETVVVCIMVLCGALLWTYVLALFCDMATNSNPGLTQFRQLLDGLNIFIQKHRLPLPLARRLREYLHQQKPGQLGKYAEKAIPVLSPALQVEVILFVHRQWLESTWFLKGLEPSCLVRLAREMTVQTLAPGEVAPMHNLYVVTRGLVLYGGRVLTRGMAWGDDVILTDRRYFLPFHARGERAGRWPHRARAQGGQAAQLRARARRTATRAVPPILSPSSPQP